MRICPHCKGEKIRTPLPPHLQPIEEEAPTRYKEEECTVCGGEGEVTELSHAIYMGRGGPPPVERRGYA